MSIVAPPAAPTQTEFAFLTGGSEMASLIRRRDWTATPLGAVARWPQSLRTAVDIILSSRYPMFVWWGRGLVNLYNDAYRPFLGNKHPLALGQSARDVWAEIWDQIGPRTSAVLDRGESTFDEALLLPMDRHGYLEETYFTFSYSPIRDDNGGIGGIFCAVTEETSRIIGERRLKLLRDVAAGVSEAQAPADVCSAAARCMSSEPRDLPFALLYLPAADGRTARLAASAWISAWHDAAPSQIPLDDDAAVWPLTQARKSGGPVLVRDLRRHFQRLPQGEWDVPPTTGVVMSCAGRDGPTGYLVAGLNPYLVFDEGYRGFISLLTGQVSAGIANARAHEEERERTEALAEIDRAKTAFFSNVSHEFRTPLSLMLGPLEDALNGADMGEEQRRPLEVAHRNCLRLLKLVNTLLDFSRLEAGRIQANYVPTDLAGLTVDLASGFQSAFDRAGLTLDLDCPPLPEPVYVDRDMWEKVVLNLLSNALKFTLHGSIAVTLAVGDNGAVLTVRDTGVGIPADELPRIFDRFHRIEGQQGRSLEGSGIGLALVHELVRLHGGTIIAESMVGRGSRFIVTIPFGVTHLPPDRLGAVPGQPSTARLDAFVEEALRWLPGAETMELVRAEPELFDTMKTASARPTVLLADDNTDMRDYIQRLLSRLYEVVTVPNGAVALEMLGRERPDLVLTDVMMPVLDGFGLLQAIRSDPVLRDIPVVLLSARAGEEARVEGMDAGADDYLTKPFSARELLARVGANLALAQVRREAADAARENAARLREANELLESRVAERTAELRDALQQLQAEVAERERAEEALRMAQKMDSIGQLTGGVAHDFNNLLTAIIGGAETLRRHLPAELTDRKARIGRALTMVEEGTRRAATLTQQLLAFGRRQALAPRVLDANSLVAGMSELLHRTLGESVLVETGLTGGLWLTMADPNQLENALLNLALNARDAMPQGGRLRIATGNVELDAAALAGQSEVAPGDYVMIAVSDTGVGMTRETLSRVFEPFYTTKEVGHGTGLGLSQVYGFIRQSDGHIEIHSEPGKGTEVRLYLPRQDGEPATAVESAERMASLPRGAGELILVVEDHDAVRAHSAETLRELGYRVLTVGESSAALDAVERESGIRLMFTDIGLPGGMNGRLLAERVRERRPGLPVLFTTGYAGDALGRNGVHMAGTDLLPKPFSRADLANRLRVLLDAGEL